MKTDEIRPRWWRYFIFKIFLFFNIRPDASYLKQTSYNHTRIYFILKRYLHLCWPWDIVSRLKNSRFFSFEIFETNFHFQFECFKSKGSYLNTQSSLFFIFWILIGQVRISGKSASHQSRIFVFFYYKWNTYQGQSYRYLEHLF